MRNSDLGTQEALMTNPNENNEKDLKENGVETGSDLPVESVSEQNSGSKKKIVYDESLFENSTVFGASAETVKKRKLKPLTKGLIISAVSVAAAAAVLAVAVIIPNLNSDDAVSSLPSTPTYTVVDIDEAAVNSVTVLNNAEPDGYTMRKVYNTDVTSSESESSDSGDSYTWCVDGYEKYDLSGAKYLVQSALSITSSKKYSVADVAKADDYELADFTFGGSSSQDESRENENTYGFDTPYSVVNLELENGVFKIVVGNSAPDSSGRYVTVSGDDDIYVVSESNLTYFDSDFKDMVNMLAVQYILPTDDNSDYYEDGSLVRIDNIKLGGTCRSKPIVIESPPDELSAISYVITSPVFRACDEEAISNILSVATSGLTNHGAYVLGYTDADLEQYGLKNPYSTCEINIGSYHVGLKFGKAVDGYYPCVSDDSDIIYKIPVSEDDDWISYKDTDIYYDSLYLEYITSISSINIDVEDTNATFELNHTTDENGTKTFTVKCDQADAGVTIEKKQLSYFYGRILNLSAESVTEDPVPDTDPYMTITIRYTDKSRSPDVIRLYNYSTRRYFYTLNGVGNSLVSSNSVKDLRDRLADLLAGTEIKRGN